MYFHNDSLDTTDIAKVYMLQAHIYLGEHPALGGAPVGKSNSLVVGERVTTINPFSSSRACRFLLPFSDFTAVRFPITAIVANLRLLLQEILIKKVRTRSNEGGGGEGFGSCVARDITCTRYNALRAPAEARLALAVRN